MMKGEERERERAEGCWMLERKSSDSDSRLYCRRVARKMNYLRYTAVGILFMCSVQCVHFK